MSVADSPRPSGDDARDDLTTQHLRRARAGDEAAREEFVRRLTPLLLAQAAFRLKSLPPDLIDTADLVADVWAAVLPRLAEIRPDDRGRTTPAVLGYTTVVMRRRVRDLLSQRAKSRLQATRAGDDPMPKLADSATGVLSGAIRAERKSAVLAALDDLGPQDREVVIHRGIEQTPFREVAALMDLSVDAVKKRYGRALDRLRILLPDSPFAELD